MEAELLALLTRRPVLCVVIKTKATVHYIEKLPPSCKDRGKIKWWAETTFIDIDTGSDYDEAQRSHIDQGDLFPRVYFHTDTFLKEFLTWLTIRKLEIISVGEMKDN